MKIERLQQRSLEVADRCSDAYSYDRYNSWAAVAKGLLKMGLTDAQAEAVMRSKWARWASTEAEDAGRPYGHASARFLVEFTRRELARNPNSVRELTLETFGVAE